MHHFGRDHSFQQLNPIVFRQNSDFTESMVLLNGK
jgi:hypothetical protein